MGILKNFLNNLVSEKQPQRTIEYNISVTTPNNQPDKLLITDGLPPYYINDHQSTILFLNWCDKTKSPLLKNAKYPQWMTYKLRINPSNFHKKLIEDGYLVKAPVNVALNKLKINDLKSILNNANIKPSGKKADLINLVIENIDVNTLQLETYYQPSEKAYELLNRKENKELIIAFENHYDITLQEFYLVKSKCHASSTPYDILWHTLNEKQLLYSKNKSYSLLRNVHLNQARLLEDEEKYTDALLHYVLVAYYDLSGCDNSSCIIPKEESLIPIGIVQHIQKLSDYYTDEIIERCSRIYLPFHHYNLNQFKEIIDSIIQETNYYMGYTQF